MIFFDNNSYRCRLRRTRVTIRRCRRHTPRFRNRLGGRSLSLVIIFMALFPAEQCNSLFRVSFGPLKAFAELFLEAHLLKNQDFLLQLICRSRCTSLVSSTVLLVIPSGGIFTSFEPFDSSQKRSFAFNGTVFTNVTSDVSIDMLSSYRLWEFVQTSIACLQHFLQTFLLHEHKTSKYNPINSSRCIQKSERRFFNTVSATRSLDMAYFIFSRLVPMFECEARVKYFVLFGVHSSDIHERVLQLGFSLALELMSAMSK